MRSLSLARDQARATPPAAGSPSKFGLRTPLSALIPRRIVTPPPVSASAWKALRTPPPNGMSPMRWSGTPTSRIRFCTMRSRASAFRVAKSVACAAGSALAANAALPGTGLLFCTDTTERTNRGRIGFTTSGQKCSGEEEPDPNLTLICLVADLRSGPRHRSLGSFRLICRRTGLGQDGSPRRYAGPSARIRIGTPPCSCRQR